MPVAMARLAGRRDLGPPLPNLLAELALGQFVEHLPGQLVAGPRGQVAAVQANAEARRRPFDDIDQHDVAENVAQVEHVDIGPRRHFALALLGRPIAVKPLQPRVADRQRLSGHVRRSLPSFAPEELIRLRPQSCRCSSAPAGRITASRSAHAAAAVAGS
jgi:hypothetical protein